MATARIYISAELSNTASQASIRTRRRSHHHATTATMFITQFLRLSFHLLATKHLLLLPKSATASCECGYLLNITTATSTSIADPILFTNILETDFLHLSSVEATQDWLPQNYAVDSALARGPYGKNATLGNVIPNPLQSAYDWAGEGMAGAGDGGLQLYVRAGATAPINSLIGMSEVVTNRSDILYGSFRAGIKTTSINGTCAAFFFYRNDTQEIDVEILSTQQQHPSHHIANLVLQSTSSLRAGFNAAGTPGFLPYNLPFDPTSAFHEYRYDWTPTAVSFYADGALLDTMTDAADVPSSAGSIHLSHWSNGDPAWSGGPPASDAVLTISYFKAYFNTSASSTPAPVMSCDTHSADAICVVPDVTGAPDGNASARAAWFADGGDGKSWNGTGSATRMKGVAVGIGKDALKDVMGPVFLVLGSSIIWRHL